MAHAAPARAAHHLRTAAWVAPPLLGAVYGVWAASVQRDDAAVTWGNVLLGIVAGVLFAGINFLLNRAAPAMMREIRALAYAAFTAIAMGFLFSLSDESVLMSAAVGCAVGAGVGAVAFYRYYTRED